MLDTSEHNEIDLSATDMRTITPEDWQAMKRTAIWRAPPERAKAMRELLRPFRSWWRAPSGRVEPLTT